LKRSTSHFSIEQNTSWLFTLPSLVLVGLFGIPILALVLSAVGKDFFKTILSTTALSALKLSLMTSSISVLLAFATGIPLAYLLTRRNFRGKAVLELLLDLPVVLPPSVAGLALLITFGRQGFIGSRLSALGIDLPFTTAAVVMAQTFVSAPLFVRSARIGFAGIEEHLVESASDLGANEWQVFYRILFPLASRAILSGLILTWTRALGEFGATLMFAGNLEGKTQTMPLAIYLGFEHGLKVAISLSVLLVLLSIVLLVVLRRLDQQNRIQPDL
jgi:molybdate transport system permease protein